MPRVTAFRPRTNQEQRELGDRYRRLDNSTARKNFVKEYATRYMQLARLPYFDLVKQIVIDLMHNLFLGMSWSYRFSYLILLALRACQNAFL